MANIVKLLAIEEDYLIANFFNVPIEKVILNPLLNELRIAWIDENFMKLHQLGYSFIKNLTSDTNHAIS